MPQPEPPPSAVAPSPPPAVEVVEGFDETRIYYQSRGVITIKPAPGLLGEGDEFALVNETSGKTLIERQPVAPSLTDTGEFSLLERGYDVLVRLYPSDESLLGKFVYGDNALKLSAWRDGDERYAATAIKLQDFDVQGPALAAFHADVQVAGNFQGWMNLTTSPVVRAGSTLTTGVFNIVND